MAATTPKARVSPGALSAPIFSASGRYMSKAFFTTATEAGMDSTILIIILIILLVAGGGFYGRGRW